MMQTTENSMFSRSFRDVLSIAVLVHGASAVVIRGGTREVDQALSFLPFESFVEKYSRAYTNGSHEYIQRLAIYQRRTSEAAAQNSRPDRLWTAGVNHLWDWTDAELSKLHGWSRSARPDSSGSGSSRFAGHAVSRRSEFLIQKETVLPAEKSWAHLASAKNVRDQGGCGSCWAIATATMLEAHTEIHSTKRTFSVQQMVSCVPNPNECGGTGGCQGATAELAMDWVMSKGCAREDEVPYTATQPPCSNTQAQPTLANASHAGGLEWGMRGWERLPVNQYLPLMRALVDRGPVAVSVAATSWHTYAFGIFNGCVADAIIDHAVVLDGYGQENGVKYWLLQNSWGKGWGEHGFLRMLRRDNDAEMCGIDNKPELGSGCKGDRKSVV